MDQYIVFHQDRCPRHPTPPRMTVINRIEITNLAASPAAADSSIARFKPEEAELVADECGVTLKLTKLDETRQYGWANLCEVRNVPRRKTGKP